MLINTATLKMRNIFLNHSFLIIISNILKSFLKIVVDILKIRREFTVLDVELLPFEF